MNYAQSLALLQDLTKFGINLGLGRIKHLLALLGNPHEQVAVIHIGGTNGKGSTSALLSAVLKEAGLTVGTYTSPHLVSYTERFLVNGEAIPEETFAALFAEIHPLFTKVAQATGETPTEFEVLTALGFLYFARAQVDVLVLEVGLGGDLDSTNVVENPLLTIITNVSLDHMDYLGPTVTEIARRKGGIIKEKCPLITASEDPEVLGLLAKLAGEKAAPFYEVSREVSWRRLEYSLRGQWGAFKTPHNTYEKIFLPLQGYHQLKNCATALLALELLQGQGFPIEEGNIREGLAKTCWPGRLEIMKDSPLVILDGAHNTAGVQALSQWLKEIKKEVGNVILVIGMLADKERVQAAQLLSPLVNKVIITKPLSPRAGDWEGLRDFFAQDEENLQLVEDLSQAIKEALLLANTKDLVLITGSLYLIGEARRLLLEDFQF